MRLKSAWTLAVLVFAALATPISPAATRTLAQSTPNPALQRCEPSARPAAPRAATEPAAAATAEAVRAPSLYVVTTVAPLTNLVFNVGGNRIRIHGLIPEGADSHTFEPKPSDAVFISNADVVFINGLYLEEPTRKLAQANLKPGAEIVELGSQAITQQDWVFDFSFPKENGTPNPHLWMNPLLARRYAEIIRDTLVRRDPANAEFYSRNYDRLAARLVVLDQAICDSIASIPEGVRKLLTYHDSFAYFAPRYGIQVIGAIQPSDFTEPSAQEVARLIEQIKAAGVPAIFGSEVFPSRVLNQIGKEAGVKYIETLADDTLPNQVGNRLYHSYLQLMVNDVTTIVQALGGDPSPLKAVPTDNLNGPDTAVESSAP
jgi:ABC-type Zn uptake system ZnuABC Zn-binding protein ZnuA